ncbi:MAG: NAD(P)-binding domain-containing protein, partial [Candidatus Puniceispirillaceae bacterium]
MIGIGLMGHGIANNILKNSLYDLTFLTHAGNQSTQQLQENGAKPAATIKQTIK